MTAKSAKAKTPKVKVTITPTIRKGPPKGNRNRQKRTPGPSKAMAPSLARDWLTLLSDPCNAKISRPCYTGTDAGYLIRTVDVLPLSFGSGSSFGTAGSIVPADILYQYTPSNLSGSTGLIIGGALKGNSLANPNALASPGLVSAGVANFITQSQSVRAYRPVAACLKWIPDGPYATRQGSVGFQYSPNVAYPNGLGATSPFVTAGQCLSACGRVIGNGMEEHEVRWVPAPDDENFTTVTAPNAVGVGSMTLLLSGVDATISTGGLSLVFNGRVEIVTVWEWQPSSVTGDVTLNTQAPLPFTSQQVLSTIKDMGHFLYQGAMRSVMQAGFSGGHALLTAGYKGVIMRSPGLLLQN